MILKNNSPKGKYFTVTVEGFPQKVWIGAYQEFNLEAISKNFSEENFSIEDTKDKAQSRNKFLLKGGICSLINVLKIGKGLSRSPIKLNDFYKFSSTSQNSLGGANIHSASYTWTYNSFKQYYDLTIILDNIKATENFQGNALKIYIGNSLFYESPNEFFEDLVIFGGGGGTFTNARYSFTRLMENSLPELIQQNLIAIESGSAVFTVEKEFIPAIYPQNSFKVVGGGNETQKGGVFVSLNLTVSADIDLVNYSPFLNASQYKIVNGFTGEEFVVTGFEIGNVLEGNQYFMKFTGNYYVEFNTLIRAQCAKYYLAYTP